MEDQAADGNINMDLTQAHVLTSRDLCRKMITGTEQVITDLQAVPTLSMSGVIPPLTRLHGVQRDFHNIEKKH